MIRVHGNLSVAGGDIVFLKVLIHRSGGGKPAQRIRPQIAQIPFSLAGGIIRPIQHEICIRFQGIIQFDLIPVRVNKRSGIRCRCQAAAQAKSQSEDQRFSQSVHQDPPCPSGPSRTRKYKRRDNPHGSHRHLHDTGILKRKIMAARLGGPLSACADSSFLTYA